jgi:hypothetical protein
MQIKLGLSINILWKSTRTDIAMQCLYFTLERISNPLNAALITDN